MTDLGAFAKATNDRNGEWYTLKSDGRFCLCECKMVYWHGNNRYYESPTYQIFRDGTRMFVSTNYRETCEKYERMIESGTE